MLAFTLRQIEVFLAACEAGSFRQASEPLGITQAGVSNHIRALERQLGYALFERRRGGKAQLSERGRQLQERARRFVREGRSFRQMADAPQRRLIRILTGRHLLDDYLRPMLPAFAARHPELALEFVMQTSGQMPKAVMREGKADVALVTVASGREMPGSTLLSYTQANLYGTPELAAIAAERGLGQVPLIAWGAQPAGATDTENILRAIGIDPLPVVAHVYHHALAIEMACQGAGAVMALTSVVEKLDRDGCLTVLAPLGRWERRLYFSPALPEDVVAILRQLFDQSLQ